MRGAALVVFAAACGRIGFDDSVSSDAAGDAAATIALCNAHTVTALNLDSTPVRVRAIIADLGYLVAIQTESGAIHIARVPTSLDSAEMHLPFSSGYTLGGLADVDSAIFVNARTGGTSYLKLLDPTFDAYGTIEGLDDITFDPPLQARNANRAWRVARFSGQLEVAEMDAAGNKSGLVANYTPNGTVATIDSNRALYEIGSRCETFLIDDAGVTSKLHTIQGCSDARVAVLASGRALLVHRIAVNQMQLYAVPDDPVATGAKMAIGDLGEARIAADGTAAWLMARKVANSAVLLGRFDIALAGSATAVPVTGPFDITSSAAFWVDGTALRVGTPCLR